MLGRILDIMVSIIVLVVTIDNFIQGSYWWGSFGAVILVGWACIEYLTRNMKMESNNNFLQILAIVLFILGYILNVYIGTGFVVVLLFIALLLDRTVTVKWSR